MMVCNEETNKAEPQSITHNIDRIFPNVVDSRRRVYNVLSFLISPLTITSYISTDETNK